MLNILLAIATAIIAHEYGHITAAVLQSVPVKQLGWKRKPFGPFLRRERAPQLRQELLISLAGPGANLLLAAMLWPIPLWWSCNLVLGLTNLLPIVKGSDGWRIWHALAVNARTQARLAEVSR